MQDKWDDLLIYTTERAIFCPLCEVPIPPRRHEGLRELVVWRCSDCCINWVMNHDSGELMEIGIIGGEELQ